MPWETARRNLNYFFLMFDRSELYGPMQVCSMWLKYCEVKDIIQDRWNVKCEFPISSQNKIIMWKSLCFVFITQAYIKKQVTPLFHYFQDLTVNWTKMPEKHTDQ